MRSRILSLKVWLLISVLISRKCASMVCPKSLRFEKGSDVTLKCNITDSDVSEIYWFKGNIPRGEPILQLENSKAGGVEYGKGHYDISKAGAMLIKEVQLEHEGIYYILVGNQGTDLVGDEIELKVTMPPRPSCPLIRSCSTCQDCSMMVSDHGNLTCEMNEIRPIIPIKWKIQSVQDVNITLYPQIATHDKNTDSWNVSLTLSYMALSCNSSVSVQCQAEDDRQLLKDPVVSAFLRFDNGNCSDKSTSLRLDLLIGRNLKFLVSLVVVLSALSIYLYTRGFSTGHNGKMNSYTHEKNVISSSNEKPIRLRSLKSKVIASSSTTNHSTVSNRSNTSNHQTKDQKLRKSKNSKR